MIGPDIGTSVVRAALADLDGAVIEGWVAGTNRDSTPKRVTALILGRNCEGPEAVELKVRPSDPGERSRQVCFQSACLRDLPEPQKRLEMLDRHDFRWYKLNEVC